MGKAILTATQSHFLELAQADAFVSKQFYLTGGTALAAFYYQHRLSEDIDLFCEKSEVSPALTDAFLKKISPKLQIRKIKRSQFFGLVSYQLAFPDGKPLKVDFNYYPFPRIAKGTMFQKLSVDSVYDIAANKLHTIFMKPRTRDYIDLYFILTKERYPLSKLIIDAKTKFDWHIDPLNLASQFLRAEELSEAKDFPTMLVSFSQKEMGSFYLRLAKSLEKDIF